MYQRALYSILGSRLHHEYTKRIAAHVAAISRNEDNSFVFLHVIRNTQYIYSLL